MRSISSSVTLAVSTVGAAWIAVSGFPWPALVLLIAGAGSAARLRRRSSQAAAGAAAERLVAARVGRLRAGGMIWGHRPAGRRSDIDLVIVGPWVAAVEIKLGSGRVKVYADGTVKAGRTFLPGHPARQAIASAAALRRAVVRSDFADAVLCVTGMRGRARVVDTAHGELIVTSAKQLRSVIRRLPHRTSRSGGRRMVEELLDRSTARQ